MKQDNVYPHASRAELKYARSLLTKKGRMLEGRFLAEGGRVLAEATKQRIWPELVFINLQQADAELVSRVEVWAAHGSSVRLVRSSELAQISDTRTSQGAVAVFETPIRKQLEMSGIGALLCENISDPGNLGTLVRSAVAFSMTDIFLCGECAEGYSPKVVRASAGTIFAARLWAATLEEVLAYCSKEDVYLLAADSRGSDSESALTKGTRVRKTMVAVCSEAHGMSEALRRQATELVRVRHEAAVESLNVAVAGSLLMRELYERMLKTGTR